LIPAIPTRPHPRHARNPTGASAPPAKVNMDSSPEDRINAKNS
jgi:hypothetical protein